MQCDTVADAPLGGVVRSFWGFDGNTGPQQTRARPQVLPFSFRMVQMKPLACAADGGRE